MQPYRVPTFTLAFFFSNLHHRRDTDFRRLSILDNQDWTYRARLVVPLRGRHCFPQHYQVQEFTRETGLH